MATCAECGVDFVSRQEREGKRGGEPQKYCSKQCGWRAQRKARSAEYNERERERLRRKTQARNRARKLVRELANGTKRQQDARRKLKRAARGLPARYWVAGPCVCCGDLGVAPANARGKPFYCSRACRTKAQNARNIDTRREAKHRRRARERGAFIAPVRRRAIYERDAWTCQLCGTFVDRDAVVPHGGHGAGRESWYAPTLDHIIPLAAGGTHEPDNTQCAHFICNARKGDRVAA